MVVYIGVVKLQVVEDRDVRAVVNELGALVEKRAVVFIRFNDEVLTGAAAGACGLREVAGFAADQVARRGAGAFQDPGEDGRGGGLAVGAGYGDHAAPFQDMFA